MTKPVATIPSDHFCAYASMGSLEVVLNALMYVPQVKAHVTEMLPVP
jgi:hypothetical protein